MTLNALNPSGPISLGRSASSAYGDSIALQLGLDQGATISLNDNDTRRVAKLPFSGSTISMPTNFLNRTVLGFNTTNNLILTADNTYSGAVGYTAEGALYFHAAPYGANYTGDITYYLSTGNQGGMNAGYPTSYSVRNGAQPLTEYKVDFAAYGLYSPPASYYGGPGGPYIAFAGVESYDAFNLEYRYAIVQFSDGNYTTGWQSLYNPYLPSMTRMQVYVYVQNYYSTQALTPFISGTISIRDINNAATEEISRNFYIIAAVPAH